MIMGVILAVVVIIIVIVYISKNAKNKDKGNRPGA
jgi:hypothetical protein